MKRRALVIEDDAATLDLMKFQLESENFEVVTSDNGKKGIENVEGSEYDIILTD